MRKCNRSIAPNSTSLKVVRTGRTCKQKSIYQLGGLSPGLDFNVYQHSIDSIERAVKERILFVKDGERGFVSPPRPRTAEFFHREMGPVNEWFTRKHRYASPLSKEQFLQNYDGRRRCIYEKAFDSLNLQPLKRKDSYLSTFVKVEKTNFTAKPDAVPRAINPRTPRYHVSLGVYIKRIEHSIYKTIDLLFNSRTIMKGLNAQNRGKVISEHWASFRRPVAIGLDASRFDQHISRSALLWEHSIYKMYFPNNKILKKLLEWQVQNKGFAYCEDGKLKYNLSGGRMSGDMNTALGNCLIMSSLVYCYAKSKNIKIKLVNDGDDCVVFLEQSDLQNFNLGLDVWFKNMGFTMTVENPVYQIEHIEFCQSNPIFTPKGYIMVRNVHKAMTKDTISIKPLNSIGILRKWTAAVGEGGLSLTGQIPVWQSFYKRVYDISEGSKPLTGDPTQETGMKILAKGMKRAYGYVHPQTRASFYYATGILPDLQVSLEKEIERSKFLNRSTLNIYPGMIIV